MKVLQINAVYKKSSTGRNVQETHEYLIDNNIHSYIASPDLAGLDENAYKIANKFDIRLHAFFSRLFGLQGYFSKNSTRRLVKYIKGVNPDIIHLHNLHGNYINLKLLLTYISQNDIPLVLTLHDTWFYTGKCCYYTEDECDKWQNICNKCPAINKYNTSWFFDRSKKMQRDKANLFSKINKLGVIGVSSWVTDDAKKSLILKNAKHYKTIYNWIDLQLFSSLKYADEIKADSKFTILGISQIWSERKGVNLFLELSKLIGDDCQIIMVGNPNGYVGNDKIKFVGPTDDVEQLARYYATADVFVNPSIQETFGKTTAEAMASGTPVVAYNSTATPELVGTDEKCGYLLNENIASAYLEKINLIKEKGKAAYSSNCRERAEKMFDKDTNLAEYVEFYKKLMS